MSASTVDSTQVEGKRPTGESARASTPEIKMQRLTCAVWATHISLKLKLQKSVKCEKARELTRQYTFYRKVVVCTGKV